MNKSSLIITILILGIASLMSVLNQRTQTRQQASQIIDLNTANEIEEDLNLDGTMGPQTYADNFATQLPTAYMGKVILDINSLGESSGIKALKLTIAKAELHLIHLFIPGVGRDSAEESVQNKKSNQNVNKWETLMLNQNANPVELTLTDGQKNSLGITPLAGGKYSEIRLYIKKAKAVLANGKEEELIIPGRNNIIRIVRPFNVYSDHTTFITLSLDKQSSAILSGNTYILKPVITNMSVSN